MAVQLIDWEGAEAREETGTGKVTSLEWDGVKTNAKVSFKATHTELREAVTCWADTRTPSWTAIQWAKEHDAEVYYRIVVHRKRNIDKTPGIKDVGNRDKVRDLIDVQRPENAPKHTPAAAATPQPAAPPPAAPAPAQAAAQPPSMMADPFETPLPPPPPEPFKPTQRMTDVMRELKAALLKGDQGTVDVLDNELLDLGVPIDVLAQATNRKQEQLVTGGGKADRSYGRTPAQQALDRAKDPDRVREQAPPAVSLENVNGAGPAVSQVSGMSRRGGSQPVATDSKPWERTNSDSRPNLSSYEAQAVMDFVNLAGRLIVAHLRQRASEDSTYELRAPSKDTVHGFAGMLLGAADKVQVSLYEGARVDRMASSYKLARQAVRESIDLFPVPWGKDETAVAEWEQLVVAHASTLLDVGYRLLTKT